MNFQKPELIAGLSDQHRQLFCWTEAVFAGLGHRSGGLFRRLIYIRTALEGIWNMEMNEYGNDYGNEDLLSALTSHEALRHIDSLH